MAQAVAQRTSGSRASENRMREPRRDGFEANAFKKPSGTIQTSSDPLRVHR